MCICINYPHWCICVAIKIFDFVYNNQNCIQYSVYNVHKLWFHTISLCVKQKLYDISCNFIMCRIRDFALFLVKICRIIQKYPPFCRKDFLQKTFPCFVYNTQKYLQWDFFRPTPYYIVPLKNYYLYYHKFIHIKFYTRDKILIVGLKKSHSYIKAFIL